MGVFGFTRIIFAVILTYIGTTKGHANHRAAFQSRVTLLAKDTLDASPVYPRRVFTVTATPTSARSRSATAFSNDLHYSMVNRDSVPKAIQLAPSGRRCTVLVTGPLTFKDVISKYPRGKIPLVIKASKANHVDAIQSLIITIKDSNDHTPVFYGKSLHSVIFQSQKLQDVNPVLRLRARDDDAIESGNGKVTYRLMSLIFQRSDGSTSVGNLTSWFRIDPSTGNVDLLRPLEDDREMRLLIFAADSPNPQFNNGGESQRTALATATLRRANVDDYVKVDVPVDVVEIQANPSGSFDLKAINLSEVLKVDGNAQLRLTILNKDDLPDEITVAIKDYTTMRLISTGALDYERHRKFFRVDVLVENRDFASSLTGVSPSLKAVVRFEVTLKNREDEAPVFYHDTLVNVIDRNTDLKDINPVLRVRAKGKDFASEALRYSIQAAATRDQGVGTDDSGFLHHDGTIEIDDKTGNVNLLKPINDLVGPQVEELILKIVAKDGSLTTVERAKIRLQRSVAWGLTADVDQF